MSGSGSQKLKEAFFARYSLSVSIINRFKVTNFLDVTLDLNTGIFIPFHKPNENLRYMSHYSNHPKSNIKSLVKNISI